MLIVPGLYIADDALLSQLREYANLGGHLVLTPRTGYADEEAVARHEVMPGVLRDAAGAHYLHFTNLRSPVGVSGSDGGLTGSATAWADELIPDGATVLARYDHPHMKNFAAITTNVFGSGLRVNTSSRATPKRPWSRQSRTMLPIAPRSSRGSPWAAQAARRTSKGSWCTSRAMSPATPRVACSGWTAG